MAPQVGRAHTLSVEANPGPLAQPVRQPGQVAVAIQIVRVQSKSPKFRHMVETCHRKSSNVVIVESAVE